MTPDEELQAHGAAVGRQIMSAIATWQNEAPRTKQSQMRILGMSELGGCREYIRASIAGDPKWPDHEPKRLKWAAAVGTWVGDGAEKAVVSVIPGAEAQRRVTVTLPNSKVSISGSFDVILGDVVDFKTKDRLDDIRKDGPQFKEKVQVSGYLLALVDAGELPTTAKAILCYIDRSGDQDTAFTWTTDVTGARGWLLAADERLDDVAHALATGQRASRDEPEQKCFYYECLAGDTQIVTREGLVSIGHLEETTARLLTPSRQGAGLTGHAKWQDCEIRSYGTAPLRTLTLRRGRATKTVRATPNHRWILSGNAVRRTDELQPGDVLRSIRRSQGKMQKIPFAQAQGFVYGDGTGSRVTIYATGGDKLQDVLPLFHGCTLTSREDNKAGAYVDVSGLPSLWKEDPDLRESTAFLVSWLSGYFAADGTVSKSGQVTFSSAKLNSVEIIRSVCAVAGIGYSPVKTKLRKGTQDVESELYSVDLRVDDLPEWFFIQRTHAARAFTDKKRRPGAYRDWTVVDVVDHGDEEEVFCAVVPDTEAFALADGLMTMNCPFYSNCWAGYTPDEEITHPEEINAVAKYARGRDLAKEAEGIKRAAKDVLNRGDRQVTGKTPEFTIGWTLRAGSDGTIRETIDVRKRRDKTTRNDRVTLEEGAS